MTYIVRPNPILQQIEVKSGKKKDIIGGLPQDNLLRRILLRVKIKVDVGTNVPAGINADGLKNYVKALRLMVGPNDSIIDIDGFSSFMSTKFETGTEPFADDLTIPATGTSKVFTALYYLDFAQVRQVLLDRSALFDNLTPAKTNIEIVWGTIDDLYDTPNDATIDDDGSECSIELFEAFDTEPEGQKALLEAPRIQYKESIERQLIDKAYKSFNKDTFQFDVLPAPAVLNQLMFVTRKHTEVRENGIVDAVKLDNVLGAGFNIAEWNDFEDIRQQNKTEYSLEKIDDGVAYISFDDLIEGGFSNIDKETNKWRLLTEVPDANEKNIVDIWARYQ